MFSGLQGCEGIVGELAARVVPWCLENEGAVGADAVEEWHANVQAVHPRERCHVVIGVESFMVSIPGSGVAQLFGFRSARGVVVMPFEAFGGAAWQSVIAFELLQHSEKIIGAGELAGFIAMFE